jgi:hypothetical protein
MQTTLRQTKLSSTPSSGSVLYGVLSDEVNDVWFEVLPLIESALEYGDGKYDTHSIYQKLKSREMQLWLSLNKGIEALCITQIQIYPQKKVCLLHVVAGRDMNHWLQFLDEIETWAKQQGCQSLEAYGRPGWKKVTGWEQIHVVIRKRIT